MSDACGSSVAEAAPSLLNLRKHATEDCVRHVWRFWRGSLVWGQHPADRGTAKAGGAHSCDVHVNRLHVTYLPSSIYPTMSIPDRVNALPPPRGSSNSMVVVPCADWERRWPVSRRPRLNRNSGGVGGAAWLVLARPRGGVADPTRWRPQVRAWYGFPGGGPDRQESAGLCRS